MTCAAIVGARSATASVKMDNSCILNRVVRWGTRNVAITVPNGGLYINII